MVKKKGVLCYDRESGRYDIYYRITPHSLRHYFCSHALEMGYTIAEVANQAGHASERTTLIYTNTSREKMKEKSNLL